MFLIDLICNISWVSTLYFCTGSPYISKEIWFKPTYVKNEPVIIKSSKGVITNTTYFLWWVEHHTFEVATLDICSSECDDHSVVGERWVGALTSLLADLMLSWLSAASSEGMGCWFSTFLHGKNCPRLLSVSFHEHFKEKILCSKITCAHFTQDYKEQGKFL